VSWRVKFQPRSDQILYLSSLAVHRIQHRTQQHCNATSSDAFMAPPVSYMEQVLLPMLRRTIGIDAIMHLRRRGFFPKGGGIVDVEVKALDPGDTLPPVRLTERGDVIKVFISAFTAGRVSEAVGKRMAEAAATALRAQLGTDGLPESVVIEAEWRHEPAERAVGDGCGVIAVAETTTGCLLGEAVLGERGVTAEAVGQRAALLLLRGLKSGACTEEWLQDQLVVFMALAEGESEILTMEPTLHTRTAIAVAEALTAAQFEVKKAVGAGEGLWTITCRGAGLRAGGIQS
jgi:RNA 3'-terminal phosphate cyclase (ATP)